MMNIKFGKTSVGCTFIYTCTFSVTAYIPTKKFLVVLLEVIDSDYPLPCTLYSASIYATSFLQPVFALLYTSRSVFTCVTLFLQPNFWTSIIV